MDKRRLRQILIQDGVDEPDWDNFMASLDLTIEERIEEELNRILDELKYGPHSDTQEYRSMLHALRELIDARNEYVRNPSKEHKKDFERKAVTIDWNLLAPILLKGGFALAAIVFWVSVEQGQPAPMKLVNWTLNLLRV